MNLLSSIPRPLHVSELQHLDSPCENLFMTSYDIENLYCNVPLKETANIILDRMFTSDSCTFLRLSKQLFRTQLEIATMNSFFIFDGNLYKQCEGLRMGLLQFPALSKMFLSHHEYSWINNCENNSKLLFYRRYMDDTFVLFRDKSHAPLFLNYLNDQHSCINFTMETEENCSLSFLDVDIKRNK